MTKLKLEAIENVLRTTKMLIRNQSIPPKIFKNIEKLTFYEQNTDIIIKLLKDLIKELIIEHCTPYEYVNV